MAKLRRNPRSALNWVFLVLLIVALVELIAFSSLMILAEWKSIEFDPLRFELTEANRRLTKALIEERTGYRALSATLGWTNRPGEWNLKPTGGDQKQLKLTINDQELRGKREYERSVPEENIRVLAFGDSFTFCAEVSDNDCWTERLGASQRGLDVLNFGVPGFSLDQALLRYEEEGRQLNPAIVFVGYMTENINRHVNVYRPFYMKEGFPASKPRFILKNDSISLVPNPLGNPAAYQRLLDHEEEVIPELGRFDYFYNRGYQTGNFDFLPSVRLYKVLAHNLSRILDTEAIYDSQGYNVNSEAFEVTIRLFDRFSAIVTADDARPVALIFPHMADVQRIRDRETKAYKPLLEYLERRGIEYVDLMDAFVPAGDTYALNQLFAKGSHYTPLGNELVARKLAAYLKRRE